MKKNVQDTAQVFTPSPPEVCGEVYVERAEESTRVAFGYYFDSHIPTPDEHETHADNLFRDRRRNFRR